jgi:hypothetical protein
MKFGLDYYTDDCAQNIYTDTQSYHHDQNQTHELPNNDDIKQAIAPMTHKLYDNGLHHAMKFISHHTGNKMPKGTWNKIKGNTIGQFVKSQSLENLAAKEKYNTMSHAINNTGIGNAIKSNIHDSIDSKIVKHI